MHDVGYQIHRELVPASRFLDHSSNGVSTPSTSEDRILIFASYKRACLEAPRSVELRATSVLFRLSQYVEAPSKEQFEMADSFQAYPFLDGWGFHNIIYPIGFFSSPVRPTGLPQLMPYSTELARTPVLIRHSMRFHFYAYRPPPAPAACAWIWRRSGLNSADQSPSIFVLSSNPA